MTIASNRRDGAGRGKADAESMFLESDTSDEQGVKSVPHILMQEAKSVPHKLPRGVSSPALCPVYPVSPAYENAKNLVLPSAVVNIVENSPHPKYRREQILWMINDVLKRGGCKPDGTPISQRYVRFRIGRNALMDALNLGLIKKVENHAAGLKSARYQLRHPSSRRVTYQLTSKKLIERRGSIEHDQKCRLLVAGISTILRDYLNAFTAPEAFTAQASEILREMEDSGKNTDSTVASFQFVESGQHRLSVKLGRLTNEIVGLKSVLRMRLLCDGSPVAEVDISSSHPTFLAHILRPRHKNQEAEHVDYIQLLSTRKFYETFENCWAEDKHLFKDYCHKKVKGADRIELLEREFMALPARSGIKLCWQVILNGKGNPARLFTSRTWQKFSLLFPIMAARMAGMKRANPSALGNALRSQEAEFVNGVAMALGKPVATLYDGWLVAEDDAEAIRQLCCRLSLELFGFRINPASKPRSM